MTPRQLGLVPYSHGLSVMEQEHGRVQAGGESTLLVAQHFPVVTFGNRGWGSDVPGATQGSWDEIEAYFSQRGIEAVKTDRGGRATCHEPGQLVLYPILPIRSVRTYVAFLEEAVLATCKHWGVQAQRSPLGAGVWVGSHKVASVGIRVSRGVSRHGLAFNVSNTLETFRYIVPCGLEGVGVTRLADHSPDATLSSVESFLVDWLLERLSPGV